MEMRVFVGHYIGEAGALGGLRPMLEAVVKGLQKVFRKLWWMRISRFDIKPSYISQSNDGKRLYRTLNHLPDGIWSHHGQQTTLLEIELSLLEFAVSITRSVHAIEVSVVRDRISRSVS